MKARKLKKLQRFNKQQIINFVAALTIFAAVGGIIALLMTNAATPVTVDSSLPNPTNVRAWGDDRVITVSWDPPANAASRGIVGYYITWGTGGVFTNAKQSTHTITQIQPVTNGTAYNIKVQSVHGSYVQVPTPGAHVDGGTSASEARASGRVSPGAPSISATPTSARVDKLRTEMTGFFDDFNTPEGAFDESKWNHATSSCAEIGQAGAFINNQFHAHNQIKSSCDRAQIISRARGVFDITGRTESDPGVIVADFDGSAHGRDVWYIDLIPTNVRKNGAPLDITSHNSAFDDTAGDPKMLRMVQFADKVHFMYYDNNKNPRHITPTMTCPSWGGESAIFAWCNIGQNPVTGMSPIPEPSMSGEDQKQFPVENVRQHWTIHVSNSKLKIFINSKLIWEGPMPADFANDKQYVVQSNLFSYNTGKGDDENPTTALLHWDNFGFNGPASPVITHNYLEGGPQGGASFLGFGTIANPLPGSPRTAKVNIPNPITSPRQARVMFTIGSRQWYYTWNANDHILVNGNRYNFPNPNTNQLTPNINEWYGPAHGDSTMPYADAIVINPAHLKSGMNDIVLNLEQDGHNGPFMLYNVHVELDYTRGTQPAYTQPKDIFGASAFFAAHRPAMSSHDSYIFIEQDMGLPSGVIGTPPTPPTDTQAPTISITSPANGSSIQKSSSLPIALTAEDNVGVDKVDLQVDSQPVITITHSPFNHAINTSALSSGNHTIRARAYDAAGNVSSYATITITLTDPAPVDRTGPTVSITAPTANQSVAGAATVSANAEDPSGVSRVDFFLDGSSTAFATDTQAPYSLQWNSADAQNGSHTISARATDSLGNTATSSSVSFTIQNVTTDTQAPSTSITAPAHNANLTGTVDVKADASDNVGVSKVELLIDGAVVATDSLSPYTFSWNTATYTAGSHTLRSRAYDAADNSRISDAVTVIILDTQVPTTKLTAPTGGIVSGSTALAADASDNIGVTRVEFLLDGAVIATDTQAPYSQSWNTTSTANGSHTLRSRAYDAAGNSSQSAAVTLTVNNGTTPPPEPEPTPKTGDVNGDNVVNGRDLSILLINWMRSNAARAQGDLNGDRVVNGRDLSILLGNWGR